MGSPTTKLVSKPHELQTNQPESNKKHSTGNKHAATNAYYATTTRSIGASEPKPALAKYPNQNHGEASNDRGRRADNNNHTRDTKIS